MTDLDEFVARLKRLQDVDYPLQIVELGAETWRDTSQAEAPVDTGFMRENVTITYLDGDERYAEADIEAGADYSGFVNQGTFRQGARPFFDAGMIAAEQLLTGPLEGRLSASIEAALSGGRANPLR